MHSTAEHCSPPGQPAPLPGTCKYLLAFDFDGTLRAKNGPAVPEEFFTTMAALRQHGVCWGINTGRTLPYLLSELLPCSPFLPDFICTCERYIYLADYATRSLRPEMPYNRECELINLTLRRRLCPPFHERLELIKRKFPQLSWIIAADDPLSVEAADSPTMDTLIPLLRDLEDSGATIQRAGRYMRFADARFHKGTALEHVRRSFQVAAEHLFIMGDGHNDIDAFRCFPEAFCAAPANAHPDVKTWMQQNGGYISPEEGVMSTILHWQRVHLFADARFTAMPDGD